MSSTMALLHVQSHEGTEAAEGWFYVGNDAQWSGLVAFARERVNDEAEPEEFLIRMQAFAKLADEDGASGLLHAAGFSFATSAADVV